MRSYHIPHPTQAFKLPYTNSNKATRMSGSLWMIMFYFFKLISTVTPGELIDGKTASIVKSEV